jgi:hypothetical protein
MWLGVSRAQFASAATKSKRREDDENFGATV